MEFVYLSVTYNLQRDAEQFKDNEQDQSCDIKDAEFSIETKIFSVILSSVQAYPFYFNKTMLKLIYCLAFYEKHLYSS